MDRSFFKHAAIYGFATLLVQAGGFILLPLYLQYLTPAEYGILEIATRASETVGAILLLGGLRQALFTFYQQAQGAQEKQRVAIGAFLLIALAALAGTAIALLGFAIQVSWIFNGSEAASPYLIGLAIASIIIEPFYLFPLTLIQARVESLFYLGVVIGHFCIRLGLCVLFVRSWNCGAAGPLLATLGTNCLFGLFLVCRELSHGVSLPRWSQLRAMISFAVPLLPCGICVFIMHHGDRFFLLRNVSSSDIGIYSLGYKLGMVAKLLSLTPLYMVWSSRMYSVARNPEAAITFGRNITNILVAYMFVSLPLSLFAREVILVMGGGQQYVAAAAMVAPVVLACFFQSAATLMDAGFYLKRQMPLKMKLTLFCTGIIVLCYSLMIPLWGIWGALAATVIGFGCLALQTYLVAQKIFPITFEWDRVAGYLGLAVALWAIGSCLPTGGLWIPAKVFVILLFPILSWHFGFVREDEKVEVGNALARILSQMQNWIRAGEKKPTPIELP